MALLLFAAGCAVGPNYEGPPKTDAPPQFKNAQRKSWKPAEPRDKEARGPWWEIFHDPALDRLEAQAVAANQDLQLAVARIREARAQSRVAAADFFPNVDVNSNLYRQRNTNTGPFQKGQLIGPSPFGGATGGTGTGTGTGAGASASSSNPIILNNQPLSTTQNDFRVPAELNWELDLFGRVRRSYEAARADHQAAEADFQNTALSVTANVANGYFNVRAFDAELGVLERTIATRRESVRIAQERLEAGLTGELDVSRARADLAGNEADLASVQRGRAEAENALATLLGQPASGFRVPRRPLAGGPPRVPAGLPSHLLERRPDVAAAERELAAANARVGVATAAFFPVIRLTGLGGFESADIGDLFLWQSRIWQLGPSVSLPIFEGGRNVGNLRAAQARYEQQVARYRQQVLVAFQDVENALADLRTLAAQSAAQDRQVAAARRTFELSNDQYNKGAVNFLDVIDAERTALQSERGAALLLGQRMQASVQLVKALGGGWGER